MVRQGAVGSTELQLKGATGNKTESESVEHLQRSSETPIFAVPQEEWKGVRITLGKVGA